MTHSNLPKTSDTSVATAKTTEAHNEHSRFLEKMRASILDNYDTAGRASCKESPAIETYTAVNKILNGFVLEDNSKV